MGSVEKLGLLKMDFLGLKTLTVIDNAVRLIMESEGVDLDMEAIAMDDPETYKLLGEVRTLGVFQLESSGMRDLLKKMKPDCFADIIALLALYRPGPLESGMVDDYIKRRHGTLKEKYDLPQLESILRETHGVILYQEQVMRIASTLAGFSLGDADLLRRAMGKKKPEEMEAQREKFMSGADEKQINLKKAKKIFDLMEKFAGYGFNKSHSTAYALVSYRTAYLKAHYPLQFFGALITADMDNTDKVIRYINDCREMEIKVLPPDVNESVNDFTISHDHLLFGLGAIKNVGSAAIDSIIETREEVKRFSSFREFCGSIDLRKVNRRMIESLIKSGACDSLNQSRSTMMNDLQTAMEIGQAKQRDRQLGQSSMFETFEEEINAEPQDKSVEEWTDQERLCFEKESIGFYVTGHPLNSFANDIAWFTDASSASILENGTGKDVSIAGIPIKVSPKTTKKGDRMAIVSLEDLKGSIDVIIWPETYAATENLLLKEEPLLVKGSVDSDGNLPKVIAKEICLLSQAKEFWKGKVHIHFRTPGLEKDTLKTIRGILSTHKGNNEIFLEFLFPDSKVRVVSADPELKVQPSDEIIREIEAVLGEDSIRFE
jgi:DNA polymerase-3 subunit alpha